MGELCFLGTGLSLWILNNFLYLGHYVELSQEKLISPHQATINDLHVLFAQGKLKLNFINKLDMKSVLSD